MNRKIFIKSSTLDILNRFEQYSAEEKLTQRPIVFKQLMALLHKHSKAKLLPSYLNLSGNLGVRSA